MTEETKGFEVELRTGKVRAWGYDVLTIFAAVVGGAGLYMLYNHAQASELANREIVAAIRGFTVAQRETTCILALPQDDRLKQLSSPNSLCKVLAREQ